MPPGPNEAVVDDVPKSSREREIEAVRKLLAESSDLLAQVDNSPTLSGLQKREYPTFNDSELHIGPLLGKGGFNLVYQVEHFTLKPCCSRQVTTCVESSSTTDDCVSSSPSISGSINDCKPEPEISTAKKTVKLVCRPTKVSGQGCVKLCVAEYIDDNNDVIDTDNKDRSTMQQSTTVVQSLSEEYDTLQDDTHYCIDVAHEYMATHVHRRGNARFALKRLQKRSDRDYKGLSDLDRIRGMIDLAIEAKFLSVLWHPNIIKMRGVASGPMFHPNFFIVMDRLHDTLETRIQQWHKVYIDAKGMSFIKFKVGTNKSRLEKLLVECLTVAYDLSAAFSYIHSNRLIHRDIKPDNIGFDVRGDVKVFDFGLAKSLSPELKSSATFGYNLTGTTGSLPYMAPEVYNNRPYDETCDVFSFAILLWEILATQKWFDKRQDYSIVVIKRNERPNCSKSYWPKSVKTLLTQSWQTDPTERPSMKQVSAALASTISDLSNDPKAMVDRTTILRERSSHSVHEESTAIVSTINTASSL